MANACQGLGFDMGKGFAQAVGGGRVVWIPAPAFAGAGSARE